MPKDLSGIKTKVALNLTKRQIICFSGAAVAGIPCIFTKGLIGTSGITFNDGSGNASILPFLQCMRKTDFRQRRFCILCSGRSYSHRAFDPTGQRIFTRRLEEKEKLRREVRNLEEKAKGSRKAAEKADIKAIAGKRSRSDLLQQRSVLQS